MPYKYMFSIYAVFSSTNVRVKSTRYHSFSTLKVMNNVIFIEQDFLNGIFLLFFYLL